jgi:hypothetical protein
MYLKVMEEIDTMTDSLLDIQEICVIILFYDFMSIKAVERIYSKELHCLCSLSTAVTVVKFRRMRWARHLASKGKSEFCAKS